MELGLLGKQGAQGAGLIGTIEVEYDARIGRVQGKRVGKRASTLIAAHGR
jgi:hypothetical protein